MHIVKDENGNVCPHEHGHGHEHGYCGEQEHGCRAHDQTCHSHEHGGEAHCHGCGGSGADAPADKNAALLNYMLDHNRHHASELDQMADKLAGEGQQQAAEQIRKAVDEFQKGNLYLDLALSLLKEN